MDFAGRVQRVRETLPEVDALLITNLTNARYLTGFSGTNGQVLITAERTVFLTDPRYEARAGDLVRDAEVVVYPMKLTDVLGDLLAGSTAMGIEGGTMTVTERDDLAEKLPVEVVATKDVVERLRRVKDADEVRLLKEAVAVGDKAFEAILDRLQPGMTERDLSLELEIFMRKNGADEISFDPIVGSGPLSAHIHHTPSDRAFEKGDLVLLDFGSRVDGYCSDLTRTVVLGPADDRQKERYDLVLRANQAGIEAVRAGMPCREVDAAARGLIAEAGFGERFGHGLGHGVGLDIHEAPRFNRDSEDELLSGDVVTVEPGVYVPGEGGVRIEDCVLVQDGGGEVLSRAPKDTLIEV